MQFLLLFFALTAASFFLAQWFIKAPPEQVKRFLLFIAILILILLSIAFFKFGGVLVASLAVLIPVIRRLLVAYNTYRYIKGMKPRGQPQHNTPVYTSAMDEKEAREILGVSDTATKEEIKAAYHKLMQKNHPDQGGSEYFAKKLNQARDVLMNRH